MIDFSKDWEGLAKAMEPYMQDAIGFDPESLVLDSNNILLHDGKDNYSLIELEDGKFFGHYLFGSARGKEAYRTARKMLEYLFLHYSLNEIYGRTPVDNKAALWMNTRLRFKKLYIEDTDAGPHQVVVLTREGFYNE